jgi:ABC-type molybdate transport system permease subunit
VKLTRKPTLPYVTLTHVTCGKVFMSVGRKKEPPLGRIVAVFFQMALVFSQTAAVFSQTAAVFFQTAAVFG